MGRTHFRNAGPDLCDYFTTKRSGRAAAIWDYDNDGDLDIIVSHIDLQASPTLLRNDVRKHQSLARFETGRQRWACFSYWSKELPLNQAI